ncbi:efflux RND transporter periplasmic adaptor subunit [Candidatus Marinimicrobia bacterium MT.SAG.4]|nr:efflux RND transporter periplasmic adaptor subunit [Candidatus Marinimicrobia bacterium MT.SAG.4]
MTKKKKYILIGGGVVLIGAMVAAKVMSGSDEAVMVKVEEVTKEKIVEIVAASGKVQPIISVDIAANVSGKILKIMAEEGDKVKEGQVLVYLDNARYVAAVNQRMAALRSAKAQEALERANLKVINSTTKRQNELYKKGLISESDLEGAEGNYEVGVARLNSAKEFVSQSEAFLDQANDDLSKTMLYTSLSGIVVKINKEVGEIALGSQFQEDIIMTIADLTEMEVLVEVDENDVVLLEIGDTTAIEIDAFGDELFRGLVEEVANSAITRGLGTQEQVTNFEVTIRMLEFPKMLRPGMSASVEIITNVSDYAVAVPIQSVTVREPKKIKRIEGGEGIAIASNELKEEIHNGTDDYVEVVFVIEDDIAVMRKVKTGITGESKIEILEGVLPGEMIVSGSYRVLSKTLQDGDIVKIEEESNGKSEELSH